MGGFSTNGVDNFTGTFTGNEAAAFDTNLSGGNVPQQTAISLKQLSGYIFGGENSSAGIGTATATAGAATLSRGKGVVTSEAITTAAGADYVLTLTNTLVAATSIVLCQVSNGTNTTEGIAVNRVQPAAGSVVIRVRNTHASAALNGTIQVRFVVIN